MSRLWLVLGLIAALGIAGAEHAKAQAVRSGIDDSSVPAVAHDISRAAVELPDSVRQRAGYQHWKGGLIGVAAGATIGLLLGLAAGPCDDCSSPEPRTLEASAIFAGIGGAFGFLVGAASPRYRWVSRSAREDTLVTERPQAGETAHDRR
jgi:hypothetical protein